MPSDQKTIGVGAASPCIEGTSESRWHETTGSTQQDSGYRSELPDAAWRSLLDYRDAMQGTTEASDVAHLMTCLSAASANLGRNVFTYDGRRVYANGFYAYMGQTSDKKTTAQRRIKMLLDGEVQVFGETGSIEGMSDELASSPGQVTSFLLLPEELVAVLTSGRNSIMQITKMFDCPDEFIIPYRKKRVYLSQPTPTIFGCSTPAWFWRHARDVDFHGGLLNRFLFLGGKRKDPIPSPSEPLEPKMKAINERFGRLAQQQFGEVMFSRGASRLYADFYQQFSRQPRHGLLGPALDRLPVYARKIAMIHSCLEETTPTITDGQLDSAIRIVKYSEECMEGFVAERGAYSDPDAELDQWFLDWLAQPGHHGMRKREIQMTISKKCGSADKFNRLIARLEKADRIEITPDKRVRLLPVMRAAGNG